LERGRLHRLNAHIFFSMQDRRFHSPVYAGKPA
jgi:hypothetical protein